MQKNQYIPLMQHKKKDKQKTINGFLGISKSFWLKFLNLWSETIIWPIDSINIITNTVIGKFFALPGKFFANK